MISSYERNRKEIIQTIPTMRYQKEEPFEVWQKRAREQLRELLGMPKKGCDPIPDIEYRREEQEYDEIRFTFQSEEGYRVPCHLLIPKGAEKPLPVMICLQGHSTGMHISLGRAKYPGDEETAKNGDRAFALRIIQEGFCALAVEQRYMGECGGDERGPQCFVPSMTALLLGRTAIGERVWDICRAIDVLEKYFPEIDKEQIMCMGNSGGGTTSFYAACMDERIKAVMPSCALCTYEDSIAAMNHCACNYIPGIRKEFDMGDLGGLIAPRKCVVVCGSQDIIFPLEGVKKTVEQMKRLYREYDAEDNCRLVIGDGGHRFYADAAWSVLQKLLQKGSA